MEYRNLGGSGLKVSTPCLGLMTFGGPEGLSDWLIGDWFETTARRHKVVLTTKCRFRRIHGIQGKW